LNAEELANNLKLKEFDVLLLHGDMDQIERNKVITAFKKKDVSTLVATDVAGNQIIYVILMLRYIKLNYKKIMQIHSRYVLNYIVT